MIAISPLNAGISPFCLLFYFSVTHKRKPAEIMRSRGDPKGRPNGRVIISLTTMSDMRILNTGTPKRPRRPFCRAFGAARLRMAYLLHGILLLIKDRAAMIYDH